MSDILERYGTYRIDSQGLRIDDQIQIAITVKVCKLRKFLVADANVFGKGSETAGEKCY